HAGDARVKPDVIAVVGEHAPHLRRGGPQDGQAGGAARLLARPGRQGVEHDDVAGAEALLLVDGEVDGWHRGGAEKERPGEYQREKVTHISSCSFVAQTSRGGKGDRRASMWDEGLIARQVPGLAPSQRIMGSWYPVISRE